MEGITVTPKEPMKRINMYFPRGLYERVGRVAAEKKVTASELIRQLVAQALDYLERVPKDRMPPGQ